MSTTARETKSEKRLKLFRSLFVGREDAYATWGDGQPAAVRKPLSDEVLAAHLAGESRVGTYLIRRDGNTPFLVIDIDIPKRSLAKAILKRLRKRKVNAYIERSKSKGFHIWIFFEKPLKAAPARQFARLVLQGFDTSKIEVFPKQDEVRKGGLGNCIWLPLCGQDIGDRRTVFLDAHFGPINKQWSVLESIRRTPRKLITKAARQFEPESSRSRESVNSAAELIPKGGRNNTPTNLASAMYGEGATRAAHSNNGDGKSTMDSEYAFTGGFQRKILALYLRQPLHLYAIVQPEYFTHPILTDVARLSKKLYDHHDHDMRKFGLSKETVEAVVRAYLGKKRQEIWPTYKRAIRKMYHDSLRDSSVVLEQASCFARDREFRIALIQAEQDVNRQDFDAVTKRFQKLATQFQSNQASAPGPQLDSYLLHQFLAKEESEVADDHLVFPIVPKDGAVLVFGLPKELKSWFALGLVIDVAAGRKALGYFDVPRAAKTLYIQVEDRAAETRKRLALVTEGGRLLVRAATLTNLRIIPRCPLNLSEPALVTELEQIIQKFRPELIVMDVVRRLFHGNVSDTKEAAEFLRVVDRLRDTYHCAIVLVHHARKNDSGPVQSMALGSVGLTAWPDVLVYTSNKKQIGSTSVADLQMEGKAAMGDALEIVVDEEADPVVCVRQKGGEEIELLRKLIEEKPGVLQKELQAKSRIPEKRLRTILKAGTREGHWLEKAGEGEGRRLAYFPAKPPER